MVFNMLKMAMISNFTFPSFKREFIFTPLRKIIIFDSSSKLSPLFIDFNGYIDIDDECWRPNVLVTSLTCW